MFRLSPFESLAEHEEYCAFCGISREENAIGFKFESDEAFPKKLGMCQLYLVSDAAYILNLISASSELNDDALTCALKEIVLFMKNMEIKSLIYPVQSGRDVDLAEDAGFDRLSDTLYAYDFPAGCDCGHAH